MGYQEGDICPKCEEGILEGYIEGECTCHINPPCFNCANPIWICSHCGEVIEPEEASDAPG